MIDLKLAEYDLETGKFLKFLELGEDFHYSGEWITFLHEYDQPCDDISLLQSEEYDLDKKDPLNRFNGLFNGRTYGEGRFVLVEYYTDILQDTVFKSGYLDLVFLLKKDGDEYFFVENYSGKVSHATGTISFEECLDDAAFLGNLHEQPELYKKIIK